MHTRKLIAILLATAFTAGCAVGPDYAKPSVALPNSYQSGSTQQLATLHVAELDDWWRSFKDPLLERYIGIALAQNLDLAQAVARVAQAKAGLSMANADLAPSATIGAQSARVNQSVETQVGRLLNATPNFDRNGNLYETNISAGWEIDLFGGLRRNREAALAEYRSSQASAVATRLSIAAQTAQTYVSIRSLQTRLSIAQQEVKIQDETLGLVSKLYNKGVAAETDVRQAEAQLRQVQATVPILEHNLEIAMNALDVLLGTPPGTHKVELASQSGIPVRPVIEVTNAPSDLLRRRPDLIAAEQRLIAANARIGASIAEYYPKFSLVGVIGSATTIASGNLFTSGASQSMGVLGLRWRLFDFGRINAQIDLAKGQEEEALAAYRQSVLRATEDVENAFSGLVKFSAQSDDLAKSETALSRARESSLMAFNKGAVSRFEILRAQDAVLRASDVKTQAETNAALAAVSVYKALGGGWQPKPAEVLSVK